MSSLQQIKTREEELPLIYINAFTGNRLLLSWYVTDAKKKVPGKYIFVEENEKGEIVKKGTLSGLKAVNDYRNNAIRLGWKFFHMPKIDVKKDDGSIIKASEVEVPKETSKKLPRKSRVYAARRRNPAETLTEMKERMQKNIAR